ncbi:MAG: hypothetical protein Q8R47_03260 [Nanoarchaeota archaeon]|nr:hypothetical protein [Nanoarchaeota archaeon]
MTNIEDRLKESPERKQKETRNIAIVCGFAGLVWYGTALYQSVADDGDWRIAIAYTLVGTLCALPAYSNYRKSKNTSL